MTTLHKRVAVIGGGIYGCGVLHQLVEKGWTDVVLLEKSELTAGSTWHAAGFCTHYSFNPTHVFMRKFSTDLYAELERSGIAPTGYHRCRGLRLTDSPDRVDEFRHGLSVGRQFDIDFEIIGPAEVEQLFPLMRADNVLAALYEPTDGYVDPSQTTHALAKLAREGGAQILRHSPVQSISRKANGEWLVSTPEHQVIAEHIVLAPGFWANDVGKLIGLDLPVTPMLHQYFVTEDHPDIAASPMDRIPLVRHHDHQWYSRRERDGLVLGAYESEPQPQTWSVDGVPTTFGMELMEPELERVSHLFEDAVGRIPLLAEAGIKNTVHGPVSYTPDGQPLIGPAPGLANAWLACGSGFGIGEGAGAGKLLAEWIVEGQPPMHMGTFDPRRFGAYADKAYRVVKAIEVFANQFATHYPLEERPAGRPVKKSAVYSMLQKAGAHFGSVYGWERANWFARDHEPHTLSFRRTEWFDAVARECRHVATAAGVIDLSGFCKFEVSGRDARRYLDRLSSNRIPDHEGDIRLCYFLNVHGTVECEFTISKIGEDHYYLNGAAAAEQHHLDWLQSHLSESEDCTLDNVTESRAVIGLCGPASRTVLANLTDTSLENAAFPWLTGQWIRIPDCDVWAMRVSYTGELGWELHCQREHQADIMQQLMNRKEVEHFGFYAMNAMRIEKGYPAWGAELTVENTAWEMQLHRFVRLNDRDFIGRDALLKYDDQSPDQRLVLCEIEVDDSDPIGSEAIFLNSKRIGVMLSGAYGHRVGKVLGFALLPSSAEADSGPFMAEILGELAPVRVLDQCPYDPENHFPRS